MKNTTQLSVFYNNNLLISYICLQVHLGPVYFMKNSFLEIIFQTFMYLFTIRKVG